MNEVGYVISSRDFLMYLDGLPSVRVFDLLQNEGGLRGVVTALNPDRVEAWILDEGNVSPGQLFKRQNEKLTFPASPALLGRAINPLGIPIDGKGPISKTRSTLTELEKEAPGIEKRQFITNQFITGISIIDMLIPIGKGQRELLIGDAHSGKTGFLIDLIVNLSQGNTICIIATIGKPITEVRTLIDTLQANKALGNTVVVAASSMESSPLIFFAPFTAMSLAEYFQAQGKDVLVILDDMGIHAKAYRELSLLGGRSPGRESYPGDIFYVQAHLLERAGNFNSQAGSGSITALPVIEINLNDFTTFIPTNLMSMTDGHLMFKAALRSQGKRPAIDTSLSVSRVGRQTQVRIVNLLSQQIRQVLSEAQNLETVSRFSSELPPATQIILRQAAALAELNNQEPLTKIPIEVQTAVLGLVFTSFLRSRDIVKYKKTLFDLFLKNPQLKTFANSLLNLQSMTQLVNKLEGIVPKL